MNIDIYGKYKVNYREKYSYISDRDFGVTTYGHNIIRWNRVFQGGDLIKIVAKLLNDWDVLSVDIVGKEIHIEKFDPTNGTGSDIIIKYEERKTNGRVK